MKGIGPSVFLILIAVTGLIIAEDVQYSHSDTCQLGKAQLLMDSAVEFFTKAHKIMTEVSMAAKVPTPAHHQCQSEHRLFRPADCYEVMSNGTRQSGVYRIYPRHRLVSSPNGFDVFCDMDTDGGGWTVIQRRGDYGKPNDYFYKEWQEYKYGFGDIEKDFWLGNDNIHILTNQRPCSLRVDLKDLERNTRMAQYKNFWIDDESYAYVLHLTGYNGTAGDSLMGRHSGKKFSTKDRDNDNDSGNCAIETKGAWWYDNCFDSNLNGLYKKTANTSTALDGTVWNAWKGAYYSLLEVEMKIRPFQMEGDLTPQ